MSDGNHEIVTIKVGRANLMAGRYAGDDLLPGRASTTTYSVTVDAPADQVWPWLVQMGQDRGGMYSYTWLENLFGLDIHNARVINPAWQDLTVGDQIRVVPAGKFGMRDGYAFRVELLEAPQALVLRQKPPEHPWDATWAFLLIPVADDRCRLLSRSRSARLPGWRGALARCAEVPMRPVISLMTRKMLRGIRDRAERQYAHPTPTRERDPQDR